MFRAWAESSVSRAAQRPEVGDRMSQDADGATGGQMPNVKKSRGFSLPDVACVLGHISPEWVAMGFVAWRAFLTNTMSFSCS